MEGRSACHTVQHVHMILFVSVAQGYCIVTDYFSRDELQPCRDAVGELVEEIAQKLYKAGKIDSTYAWYSNILVLFSMYLVH